MTTTVESNSSAPHSAREKLLTAAVELFRTNGYDATSLDDICRSAGVTKGALFHHFAGKQAIAAACLEAWSETMANMVATAPFNELEDPVERVLGWIDFFSGALSRPETIKSCLAGTIVQEVSESNPALRDAAHGCIANGERRFQTLLDEACADRERQLDTASLARLWSASLQGSLLLYKATRDPAVFADSLGHVHRYIESLFSE
ncbi:MAG: TetR/AcrR family transcriptional regulator [Pirellulales bacterium]